MNKLLLFAILIFFSACKRWQHEYPEDGQRSKITPLDRLVGKTWVLTQLSLNGQDYMDTVRERFGNFEMKLFYTKYNLLNETDAKRLGGIYTENQVHNPIMSVLLKQYQHLLRFIVCGYK